MRLSIPGLRKKILRRDVSNRSNDRERIGQRARRVLTHAQPLNRKRIQTRKQPNLPKQNQQPQMCSWARSRLRTREYAETSKDDMVMLMGEKEDKTNTTKVTYKECSQSELNEM